MKTEFFKNRVKNPVQKLVLPVAIAGFFLGAAGCNRTADDSVVRDEAIVTESSKMSYSGTTSSADTLSGTTANAPATSPDTLNNNGAVPPVDSSADSRAATAGESDAMTSETKTVKKTMKKKSDHKKAHKHGEHGAWHKRSSQSNDAYVYGNSVLTEDDDLVFGSSDEFTADDGTVSATTVGVSTSRIDDGGLSPFSQEPASRIPSHIGSTQLTGKDKSVSSLEGASVFQDPSAQERDRLNR